MHYDPIKHTLGRFFNTTPFLRKVFYKLLDLLLLRSWHVRKELKKWAAKAPNNAFILDAGSGFGQYTYFLSSLQSKWTIKAVDVKEEQIEDCNRFFTKINRENTKFEYCDLTQLNETEKYDAILSVDVMEHILDDVKVFENFYKAIKQGGMLLVSTPSDQGGSDVHEHEEESFIEEHVRDGYNINDIQEKLKQAGFGHTEAHYQYGKSGQISWRLSMKYPILMIGVSKLFFIILPFYYLIIFPICWVLNSIDVNTIQKNGTGLIVKAWK